LIPQDPTVCPPHPSSDPEVPHQPTPKGTSRQY
jgi:hypothetical protein